MIWYLPVRWDMMSRMPVEAYSLDEAIEKGLDICDSIAIPEDYVDLNYSEMIDGSFELEVLDRKWVRDQMNDGMKDLDVETYPELKEYKDFFREIGPAIRQLSAMVYRVQFKAGGADLTCDVWVTPAEKYEHLALGLFFMLHPNITYKMITGCGWIQG